jgi:outer membrane immunogenic protein
MRIRSLALTGAAVASLVLAAGQYAFAADYPVLRGTQTEDVPPAPSEVFGSGTANWGGFYFGGTAGFAGGQFDPEAQSEFLSRMAFGNHATSAQGSPLLRFGKASNDKGGFGGFIGYNVAFGDAIVGLEAEYFKTDVMIDQRGDISRLYTGIFPVTIPETAATSPLNTQTTIGISGHTTTKLEDFGIIKARAGYAIGNFMPFINIGAAIGRISTNAKVSQQYSTVENYNTFNTRTTGRLDLRAPRPGPSARA